MDDVTTRCGVQFSALCASYRAFLIDTACRLEINVTPWKQREAVESNRRWIRGFTNLFLRRIASALSLRPRIARGPVEDSAGRVLDCRFRRVIAFPPGGGAVTLIQTQRAKSQLELSRHEMPVRTIAYLLRSATTSARILQPEVIHEIL